MFELVWDLFKSISVQSSVVLRDTERYYIILILIPCSQFEVLSLVPVSHCLSPYKITEFEHKTSQILSYLGMLCCNCFCRPVGVAEAVRISGDAEPPTEQLVGGVSWRTATIATAKCQQNPIIPWFRHVITC